MVETGLEGFEVLTGVGVSDAEAVLDSAMFKVAAEALPGFCGAAYFQGECGFLN